MDILQKLINQQQSSNTSVIGTRSLAHKGTFLNTLSATREKISPWIVDSGASDHMTGDARIFNTYIPCHENFSIRIANGSLSRVTGTGSVVISKNLTLNYVLLVPNLDSNLLSISKLTQELNYVTKFFPNSCEF